MTRWPTSSFAPIAFAGSALRKPLPQLDPVLAPSPVPTPVRRERRWLLALLLLLSLAVYGLYFLHLSADFPNQLALRDWSKYTDEGWYANAAIRSHVWGHWYLRGDFNPAVALPLWPLLQSALFHFTGVSLVAARGFTVSIFAVSLFLAYLLMCRWTARIWSLAVVALAATNPFLYVFHRMAILEPLVLALTLAAFLLCDVIATGRDRAPSRWRCSLLGMLLTAMLLTKTTTVMVFPSLLYMLWYPQRRRPGRFRYAVAVAGGTMAVLLAVYYFGLVRPHYRTDFFYLFKANAWPHPASFRLWLEDAALSVKSLLWPDPVLACLAGIVVVLSLFAPLRRLWRVPLYPASLLAIGATLLFVFWHNNQQPRYLLLLAVLYGFMAALGVAALLRWYKPVGWAAVTLLGITLAGNLRQLVSFVIHPEYTWVNAARNLTGYIDAHPNGRRLLLSISGDEISLMTGLPAICDDFGPYDLSDRIETYQPGWFAAWNDVDPGTLEDIHDADFRLVKTADFPALNDPDRNVLRLYKMLPQPGPDEGVVVENDSE